jgi:Flp pilus assembly protein TadG
MAAGGKVNRPPPYQAPVIAKGPRACRREVAETVRQRMNSSRENRFPIPERRRRGEKGQSMAEFALMVPLFIAVVFVAITFAVIGQAALAVSQLAYNGARYAAVHPSLSTSDVSAYIKSGNIGSPTITGNNGANLTVTVSRGTGSYPPVTVTIAYNLQNNPLVGSMSTMFSALGFGSSFPTTLSATEIVMSE